MVGLRLVRLIETHSDQLANGLLQKLHNSDRTSDFRKVPPEDLRAVAHEIYRNLSDWLLTKTESDIELRYSQIGARRVTQGVTLNQLVWAILLSKEHLWAFLQREAYADRPVELFGELELMRVLDQFFDRAAYYAVVGYEHARNHKGEAA